MSTSTQNVVNGELTRIILHDYTEDAAGLTVFASTRLVLSGTDWPANRFVQACAASLYPRQSRTEPVGPIHLFDLAARQAQWLSAVLDQTALELSSTSTGHMALSPADQQHAAAREEATWETSESGNSVSLEQEMMKASDVNRSFSLNSSIVKAFHGMLMASVKG